MLSNRKQQHVNTFSAAVPDFQQQLRRVAEANPTVLPSQIPSEMPSQIPSEMPSVLPSGAPSAMPTVIACGEMMNEINCTSLDHCDWWTPGNIAAAARMLRRVRRPRRPSDGGDDNAVVGPPPNRADDGECRPKDAIPPRNEDNMPSAAPSSTPPPQYGCECSTKSSSIKSTTRPKSKSSKSQTSTIAFPITLSRNRRRRHRSKKSSKKNSRRLREVGQAALGSNHDTEHDRIAQLERVFFEFADLDIDLETATLDEKYEAMLIAFSTRENEEGILDAANEEGTAM